MKLKLALILTVAAAAQAQVAPAADSLRLHRGSPVYLSATRRVAAGTRGSIKIIRNEAPTAYPAGSFAGITSFMAPGIVQLGMKLLFS